MSIIEKNLKRLWELKEEKNRIKREIKTTPISILDDNDLFKIRSLERQLYLKGMEERLIIEEINRELSISNIEGERKLQAVIKISRGEDLIVNITIKDGRIEDIELDLDTVPF